MLLVREALTQGGEGEGGAEERGKGAAAAHLADDRCNDDDLCVLWYIIVCMLVKTRFGQCCECRERKRKQRGREERLDPRREQRSRRTDRQEMLR